MKQAALDRDLPVTPYGADKLRLPLHQIEQTKRQHADGDRVFQWHTEHERLTDLAIKKLLFVHVIRS